ncbi:MAG TPA: MBL fold metallo-hydrolase [Chitinophagaceae bacterium]|nr:MBL fold metallo-hydrolase [Chitinophagaceae bacterium]
MLILLIILACLTVAIYLFMRHPQFGSLPSGERLKRIEQSPNYKDGQFQNIHYTPNLAEGVSMFTVMRKFFFEKRINGKPPAALPSTKTDLLNLDPSENVLVWFGHSSYFLQADGKRILVDPVFSGAASPISFTTRAFAGTDIYTADDFPTIDYLVITHDHWDHLDYKTIKQLRPKIKLVVTGLGVGAHLERWGYDKHIIIEKDWNEQIDLDKGFTIHTTSARHFSGRTFKRNTSLWMSYVLQTPSFKLYLGGDSGYDTHFAEIGNTFGPFDLAILECGQYSPYWKYIHMMPEENVQAGIDLKATVIFPVHWAKFSLSLSEWNDPILRVTAEAKRKDVPLIYPMIGEKLSLDNFARSAHWWEL